MSHIAGIVAREQGTTIADHLRRTLASLVSRNAEDDIATIDGASHFFCKFDAGRFGSPGIVRDESGVTVLAGDPLPVDLPHSSNRFEGARLLHASLAGGDSGILERCSGTFCAATYDTARDTLMLSVDKMGVRPLYYWVNEQYVAFASALRILEALPLVPKRMSLRGVAEIACFGFPLADRTGYVDIRTINAGELITATRTQLRKSRYWRWDTLAPIDLPQEELRRSLHQRFVEAVERRLGSDRVVLSLLSGGLDSRCIVAALRELGRPVHTINFAPEGTQDLVFGGEIAKRLGTIHHQIPLDAGSFGEKQWAAYEQCLASPQVREAPIDRPGLVWSGDGGSVTLGHVYLTPELVDRARQGSSADFARAFLAHHKLQIDTRIFREGIAEQLAGFPVEGIAAELDALECGDRGRAAHLFLMLNDQRRHMSERLENNDLWRIDYQLPYFDADFMSLILGSPIGPFLRHAFYNRWLPFFTKEVTAVPWQAYPGHEACPIADAGNLRYQWRNHYDEEALEKARQTVIADAEALLRTGQFADTLLKRSRLRLFRNLMRFRRFDYAYLIRMAGTFQSYWNRSGGVFE